MSRSKVELKHRLEPDSKFKELLCGKFINCLMWDGKKSAAERIFYGALESIAQSGGVVAEQSEAQEGNSTHRGLAAFFKALDTIKPTVEVRSRRVGGATYAVPVEISPKRAEALAIRWLIAAARARSENTMSERLRKEIVEAFQGRGAAVKRRENTHRMAEANRAYAHYRW